MRRYALLLAVPGLANCIDIPSSSISTLGEHAGQPLLARAAEPAAPFSSPADCYSMRLPHGWTEKQKAGANALFENPDIKSTNIGVTVSPVRVDSLQAFGDIDSVADKLLAAERKKVRPCVCTTTCSDYPAPLYCTQAHMHSLCTVSLGYDATLKAAIAVQTNCKSSKSSTSMRSHSVCYMQESTLGVDILEQSSKSQGNGALQFDYEYELNSTRGRKRIINAVTIWKAKLYIVNAQHKCEKDACTEADEAVLTVLRDSVSTFELTC